MYSCQKDLSRENHGIYQGKLPSHPCLRPVGPESGPSHPGWWSWVGLPGAEVLLGFWEPALDLDDPGGVRGVGREELEGLAPSRGRAHAHPQVAGRLRRITGLGHVDEPEVVGLRLLG